MKKLIPCFLLLFVVTAKAQSFEGTIKWSVKMELDSATLEKMQGEVKAMRAKMNEPEMKAMLDANPQMKAQMENSIKGMLGGEIGMTFNVKIKGQNSLTKMEGSPLPMEVLYLKDKGQSYLLYRRSKSYSILSGKPGKTAPPKPQVTKTLETSKILNYTCTKYLVETRKGKQWVWATLDIKDIDWKSMGKQHMTESQTIFFDGVEGFPLLVEASVKEGTTIMEMIEIKKESLNAADFIIPPDFKEED